MDGRTRSSSTSRRTAVGGAAPGSSLLTPALFRVFKFIGIFLASEVTCLLCLTPLLLVALWIYQCCFTLGWSKQSGTAYAATLLLSLFLAIAWIPTANLILVRNIESQMVATGHSLNPQMMNVTDRIEFAAIRVYGYTPIASFTLFTFWALSIVFRHGGAEDSYEQEDKRRSIVELQQMELEPAIDYDRAKVYNAKEYFCRVRESVQKTKSRRLFTFFMLAFLVASILVLFALWVQTCPGFQVTGDALAQCAAQFKPSSNNRPWGSSRLVLSVFGYLYYLGIFTILGTALLFVRQIYQDQVTLIQEVAVVAERGVDADKPTIRNDEDLDEDEFDKVEDEVPESIVSGIKGTPASSNPAMINASPPATAPGAIPPLTPQLSVRADGAVATQRSARRAVEAVTPAPSTVAGAKANVSRFDPYNITHLNAWDAIRKVSVEEVNNTDSVLNSIFGPTMVFTVGGVLVIVLYFLFQLYEARQHPSILCRCVENQKGNPNFIFGTVGVTLACVFALFVAYDFAVVYSLARNCSSAIKRQFLTVTRLEFSLAQALYEMAYRRVQGEQRNTEFVGGKERKVADLEVLYGRVSSLQANLEAFQPRPKLLLIDSRFVKFVFLYFFLATALALSVMMLLPSDSQASFTD